MTNDEIQKLDFSEWPLPDDYLVEIGRVAALWSGLESLMNMCIGKLAGFNDLYDPTPFILITHSSFPQRLDMFSTFCERLHVKFPSLTGYDEVIGKLKSAQKLRNKLMHHGLAFDADSGAARMSIGSARGSLKTTVREVKIADLRRAVLSIDEAQRALYQLVFKRKIPPAWKKRSVKQPSPEGSSKV